MEPKMRLKGFQGEWEKVLIGKLGTTYSGLSGKTKEDFGFGDARFVTFLNVLTNAIINTSILEAVCVCEGEHQNEVRRGDLLFNTSSETPEEVGMCAVIDEELKNVYLNSFCFGFRVTDKNIDPTFIAYLMRSHIGRRIMSILAQGATRYNLSKNSFCKAELLLPKTKAEQQLISKYFTSIDSLIQSTTKKIESLKQVKAASLQSMFPQEGETTPRVRFKGFEGEWEEVSLGEETYPAGIKNHDNLPLESYSISNECGFIPQNVQFENGGMMATADKRMYYIVSKNSFGYNPARINVGSLGYYTGDDDVIVSSLYEIFKTSDRIFDTFLLCWFKTSTFQKLIEQYQEGGVRFYFFYDKLCMCHTLVPSYEEQKKIASYFTNLDFQISLQTQRLEKLKQIKSACLDNMFV